MIVFIRFESSYGSAIRYTDKVILYLKKIRISSDSSEQLGDFFLN